MGGTIYKDKQEQREILIEQQQYITPVSPQLAEKLHERRTAQLAHREKELQKAQQLGKFERRRFIAPPVDDAPSPQAIQAFYQPGQMMLDTMTNRLRTLETEATSQTYAQILTQSAGTPLSTDKLTQTTQGTTSCLQPLGALLSQLQSCDPATVTSEQTTAMVQAYRTLKLETVAPSHRYLDNMEQLDPHSVYVLLYHCVTLAMEHIVEGIPPETVDQAAFAKLYGLAAAAGLAAGSLCCSEKFLEQRRLEQEAAEAEQRRLAEEEQRRLAEEEQKRREEALDRQAKMDYLRTGISAEGGAPSQWILGEYTQFVVPFLGAETMQLPWKEFAVAVERIRARLEDRNLPALERALDLHQKQRPGMVLVRQQVLEQTKTSLADLLISRELEEIGNDLDQIITDAMAVHGETLDLYDLQRAALLQNPHMKRLEKAVDHWLKQNASADREIFQTRVDDLTTQVEENLVQAKGIMAQSISSSGLELLLDKLAEQNSDILLAGSPGEVAVLVQKSLRSLQAIAPQAAAAEATFRAALRSSGVQSRWFKLADQRIVNASASSPEEMNAALQGLQTQIDQNLEMLETHQTGLMLKPTAWKDLDLWAMEQLDQPTEQFRTVLAEKITSLMTSDNETLVSREQALYGEAGVTLQSAVQEDQGIIAQSLRGESLCAWSGFNGLYENYTDQILSTLDHLLQSGSGPVASLKDLDTLPRSTSAPLVLQWRSSLAQAAQTWATLDGAQAELVRRRLLPGILKGEIHGANCAQAAKDIQDQILRENTAQQLRFLSLLGSENTACQNEIQYRYLDSRRGGYFWTKGTQPSRRMDRLREAKELRKRLAQAGQEQSALIWLGLELEKGTMNRGSFQAKPGRSSLLLPFAEDIQSHAFELLISGYENMVLSDPAVAEAFVSKHRKDYQLAILPAAKLIHNREIELVRLLNQQQYQGLSRRRGELLERLRPFIGGLLEGKEHEERNRLRYGVSNWAEALQQLKPLLDHPEQLDQADVIASGLSTRIQSLREAGNGVLQPILDRLMTQPEVWQTLSTGHDGEVAELETSLLKQYDAPLSYLRTVYYEDPFLIGQMVEESWSKLSTQAPDQWNWKDEFRSLYVRIAEHKTSKNQNSLTETVHEILTAKDGIKAQMAPYIADLIHAEGVSFLLNNDQLEETLRKYVQQIQANETSMEQFLTDHPQEIQVATGFRQYLHTKRFTMKEDAFAAGLQSELEQFLKMDLDTRGSVYKAKQEMVRRAGIMSDIETKKAAGRQADQDILQLRQLTGITSPLVGKLETPPSQKEIEKVKDQVSKQYPLASTFVRDCLTERILAGDSKEALSALSNDLTVLSAQLTHQGVDGTPLKSQEAEAFMTWLVTHRQGALDQDLPQNLAAFREARALVASVSGIEMTSPVLDAERQQVADSLAAGLYTMSKEDFLPLAQRRLSYLKAAAQMESVWTELLKPYTEKQTLYMGLRDYFHADLLQGVEQLNVEALRTQAEALLKDEISRQYLINSTSLLGEVSSTSLKASEVTPCTMADRESFETFLSEKADPKLLDAYNQLDVAQRQIFALVLTAPGKFGTVLPSNRLLESNQASRSRQISIQQQLQSYIHLEDFAPQVNYSLALTRLQTGNGGINAETFQQVLDFTLLCATRRQDNQPVDFSRLSDSLESRTEARRLLRASGTHVPEPMQPQQLTSVSKLTDLLDQQGGKEHQALISKLTKLELHQQQLLIWALQDRTALDYTTRVSLWDVGGGTVRGVVNTELQADLFTRYASSGYCPQITAQSLSQALDTLYSYQLRDNVDLNRRLRKEDFVDLERKSPVDWALLERAMDFVHEMDQARTRLIAIQNARDYVMERGNALSKEEFQSQTAVPMHTVQHVNDFLRTQAEKDGQIELYAGYLALSEAQRTLFIKALGHRDLLDISKQGIMANRFGMSERDYANPRGRFELIDQHLRHTQGNQGLSLEDDDCRNAILTALSAQVDDSQDFVGEQTDKKKTSLSRRDTAVDWKLVSRALQLVYRTTNERDIALEDRELYVSAGDLSQTGTFQFDGAYLRQNIHNAGNRFTRFLGRRVSSRLQDAIPGPAKRLALMLLPTKMANQVNRALGSDDEESSINETAEDFLGTLNDFLEDRKTQVEKAVGTQAAEKAGELAETAEEHLGHVNAAISIGKNAHNISKLAVAEAQAKQAKTRELDLQNTAPQTAEQKELSDRAKERNTDLQRQGSEKALSRQADELIQTISGVVGGLIGDAVGDESGVIEALVEEAGELINFLRNWLQDEKSVAQYFSRRNEAGALRGALNGTGLSLPDEMTDLNLICRARGFENHTEMASFVGLNIVRSLLFCAGPYNPQDSTRILAIATLTVLGQAEAIGLQDSETAQSVYGSLMGGQYR